MVKVLMGDILKSNAQTLVNTVNCVGIMGKGIALEFKRNPLPHDSNAVHSINKGLRFRIKDITRQHFDHFFLLI